MTQDPAIYGLSERFPDPVIVANPATREIVDTNPAASDFFGHSEDELHAMEILDLHPGDQRDRYRSLFEEHFRSQPAVISHFEDGAPVYVVTNGGDRIPVEIKAWAVEGSTPAGEPPLFKGVFRDVSERRSYERQLMEQRDGLEVLNQILRHDVRNNLQTILSYTDVLSEYVDDDGGEYLDLIRASATDAVDLTRTARETADMLVSTGDNQRPVPFRETLMVELDKLRSEYPDADVGVDGSIPETAVVASWMLDSVFRNVLTNAIQHNDAAVPTVRVEASADAETVTLLVADNGPGIPDGQKEALFGKGETGVESGRTGLGLYLVDTLVSRADGDVWIEDNDPTGTVVVLELPRAE